MSENRSDLTGFYVRGREDDWMQQKRENYRRWRRRGLAAGGVAALIGFTALFFIYDYPRESGLTDALGLTCGEYLRVESPGEASQFFVPWSELQDDLERAAAEELGESQADTGLEAAVDTIAEEIGAEPAFGALRGFQPTQREFSAAAAGERLIVGHHEEAWTVTDRLSVVDPSSAEVAWTAKLVHPRADPSLADEQRQPVLYGVGAAGETVVVQTPTYRGDTDVVTAAVSGDADTQCLRLEGGVEAQPVLAEAPDDAAAWPQTINLNAARSEDGRFHILHGLSPEQSEHVSSPVDITSGEAGEESSQQVPWTELPEVEIPEQAHEQTVLELHHLRPLGEEHCLLTWEGGYTVLTAG